MNPFYTLHPIPSRFTIPNLISVSSSLVIAENLSKSQYDSSYGKELLGRCPKLNLVYHPLLAVSAYSLYSQLTFISGVLP
jgi:hypothetical protein